MSEAGVLTKTYTYEELEVFAELLCHYNLFAYIETFDQRPYIRNSVELPKAFLTFRMFGEFFELYVKPSSRDNKYQAVFITDCTNFIEGEYLPLRKIGQRSFFLDERVMGSNQKLLVQYYESEHYGEFMRWKGVVSSE